MTCGAVARRLSAYRDGELDGREAHDVSAHLELCAACADRWRSLQSALDALGDLAPVRSSESIASAVLARLEVETRGPGLALLFRPRWAARPLILPSLLPAALVLVAALAGVFGLDAWTSDPLPEPYGLAADATYPRALTNEALPPEVLLGMDEGTLFVESVVSRDGRVSAVTLIEGDSEQAAAVLDALRYERFEPGRYRGQPVSMSVYRLISRMEVRAPLT